MENIRLNTNESKPEHSSAPDGVVEYPQRLREGDIDKFKSDDPYKVLGLPKGSLHTEVLLRKKQLLKNYHPDRYQNPFDRDIALEIAKYINEAVDKITGKNQIHQINDPAQENPPPNPHNEKPRDNPFEYKGTLEELKADMVNRLTDIQTFRKYWHQLSNKEEQPYLKQWLIQQWVSEDVQRALQTSFLKYVTETAPNIEAIFGAIQSWGKDFFVDVGLFIDNPKICSAIQHRIALDIQGYRLIAEGWQRHVDTLYEMGFDISVWINEKEISDVLSEMAHDKLEVHGKKSCRNFITEWRRFGWKPTQDLIQKSLSWWQKI